MLDLISASSYRSAMTAVFCRPTQAIPILDLWQSEEYFIAGVSNHP